MAGKARGRRGGDAAADGSEGGGDKMISIMSEAAIATPAG
jgi:hypothetical protein